MKVKKLREVAPGVDWLQDYLRTAQSAYGTGVERQTRAQRDFAMKHMNTLMQEAQNAPQMGGYVTLAQNLVNPVMPRRPAAAGVGVARALNQPGGDVQRGFVYRNPTLT